MAKPKLAEGRFTISGHGHEDKAAPSIGAALSGAQDFARIDRYIREERTYYVRELGKVTCAMVTKDTEGVVHTTVVT